MDDDKLTVTLTQSEADDLLAQGSILAKALDNNGGAAEVSVIIENWEEGAPARMQH